MLLLATLSLARAAEPLWRESHLAMGTVVGVTLRLPEGSDGRAPEPHAAVVAAFAAVERWEAALSEWRPDSITSALNAGGVVRFDPPADRMFRFAAALEAETGGAFRVMWAGGVLSEEGGAWRAGGGKAGLGAMLKGFLVDRAAEALTTAGWRDFVIDAAGDVYAHGDAPGDLYGPGAGRAHGGGWPVSVRGSDGKPLVYARLRNQAISTSGDDQQPGHIRDPRTGAPVTCTRSVSVVAGSALVADALATAIFASCGARGVAERHDAWAIRVDEQGAASWTRGARHQLHLLRSPKGDRSAASFQRPRLDSGIAPSG